MVKIKGRNDGPGGLTERYDVGSRKNLVTSAVGHGKARQLRPVAVPVSYARKRVVPLNGLEPLTPSLRMMCSTS